MIGLASQAACATIDAYTIHERALSQTVKGFRLEPQPGREMYCSPADPHASIMVPGVQPHPLQYSGAARHERAHVRRSSYRCRESPRYRCQLWRHPPGAALACTRCRPRFDMQYLEVKGHTETVESVKWLLPPATKFQGSRPLEDSPPILEVCRKRSSRVHDGKIQQACMHESSKQYEAKCN